VLRRGYVYWAEMDKRRPAVVLSPDLRNERASDVIVIPCSRSNRNPERVPNLPRRCVSVEPSRTNAVVRFGPWHVALRRGEGGLRETSIAKCEQVTTLPKSRLAPAALGGPLTARRMLEIERGVLKAIGIVIV
jgi:mRNA-degrading endonuclease toxin of MazEF toxin-antitoxin module